MCLSFNVVRRLGESALDKVDNRRKGRRQTETVINSCNNCPYFRPDDDYSYCKFYEKQIDMWNLVDKPEWCKLERVVNYESS